MNAGARLSAAGKLRELLKCQVGTWFPDRAGVGACPGPGAWAPARPSDDFIAPSSLTLNSQL